MTLKKVRKNVSRYLLTALLGFSLSIKHYHILLLINKTLPYPIPGDQVQYDSSWDDLVIVGEEDGSE